MSETRSIETPHGQARLETFRARSPLVTLLLSHGAGGGTGARDLQALARELPGQGAHVVLLEQPWKVAGRKVATELIQDAFTPDAVAAEAERLLRDSVAVDEMRAAWRDVKQRLGGPGASRRAAEAILRTIGT